MTTEQRRKFTQNCRRLVVASDAEWEAFVNRVLSLPESAEQLSEVSDFVADMGRAREAARNVGSIERCNELIDIVEQRRYAAQN